MDQVRRAVKSAATEVCLPASAEVRKNALSAGWPANAARSLRVSYSDEQWSVESSNPLAEDMEYGNGESVPSPAVRQFANRPESMEENFLSLVEQRLGAIL